MNSAPFICSICGLSRTERYNPDSRYCSSCQSSYVTWRSKRRRSGKPASMATYREWREAENLPVVSASSVRRGRPTTPPPYDYTQMSLREATMWFYNTMKEQFPDTEVQLFIRTPGGTTFEILENGWLPVNY